MKVYIVFVGLILVLFVTSLVFLIFPNAFPPYLRDDLASRIGIAQWWIEIASLIALGLAVWEFRQTQKKPDLRLWLLDVEKNKMNMSNGDEVSVTKYERKELLFSYGDNDGMVQKPSLFLLKFNLCLENKGQAAARWVKINMISDEKQKYGGILRFTYTKTWSPQLYSPEMQIQKRYDFNGGDDFISYSHPSGISDITDWVEDLGLFEIIIPPEDLPEDKLIRLFCYIEAYDFPRRKQVFTFRVNPEEQLKSEQMRKESENKYLMRGPG